MVRQGSLKLIYDRLNGQVELYDLATDPRERVDVSGQRPEAVRRLRKVLEGHGVELAPAEPISPLSAEEAENLRSLGYLE